FHQLELFQFIHDIYVWFKNKHGWRQKVFPARQAGFFKVRLKFVSCINKRQKMEEQHIVKILSVEAVTHDVKRFRVEKPADYRFLPGQATEVTIHQEGWLDKRSPFTFTSLNAEEALEFTIKIYDDHQGVTHRLGQLTPGDE